MKRQQTIWKANLLILNSSFLLLPLLPLLDELNEVLPA